MKVRIKNDAAGGKMKADCQRNLLNAALIALAAALGAPSHAGDLAIPLAQGWNLLGNTGSPSINVQTDPDLGDATKVTTIWKWNAQESLWVFYAPQLANNGTLASYASGKGYQVLTTIEPGEGFWVNAAQAFTLNRAGITPFSLGPTYTGASGLVTGWNLVATSDVLSPSQLDAKLGGTASAPSFVTMWAWSTNPPGWYFYAPTLAANGMLASYIQSKGYLDFGTLATASSGLGFWLNSSITATKVSVLSVSVSGSGTVSSSTPAAPGATGIGSCTTSGSAACGGTYLATTQVVLTASASAGWTFIGWSGTGAGVCATSKSCTLAAGTTSVSANFATLPGAPTITTVTPGNESVTVSFSPPSSDGGAPITSYTVTSSPNNPPPPQTGSASPIVVTGLTNGVKYTFTVKATNAVGTGPASIASATVIPATTPGAPTIGTATAGNAQATVAFTAPASTGGAAISSYTVTSNPDGVTATGGKSPIIVAGLTNGKTYTFTVTATNSAGTSAPSAASNSVTPLTVPGAPTIGTATGGNAQASVAFTPPASDGGATITSYTVTSSPGGITATGAASPIVVSGLTNGVTYTFTVKATNSAGTGSASAASNSVTPATVPGAPTIGTATGGIAQASVSFTLPASNGGAAITSYTVTSNPDGLTGTGAASPIVVSGLTIGTAYTFTVTATNSVGTGPASAASNSLVAATLPGAPTIGTATAGNAQATVAFTAPASNGGAAITSYTVTSSPGGFTATGSASPIVITGLTNGTAYTFTVTATNSAGTGPASAVSNSVTPAPTAPDAPTIGTATARNAMAIVTFTAPASNGGAAITSYTVTSSPGVVTATGTASPILVTGLTNGTAYTFTVAATNSIGIGATSAASNSVTPAVPPPYYLSPSGSDSNNGLSASAPWKTFAKAFSVMVAGDELILLDGTYSGAAGTGVMHYDTTAYGTGSAQPPSGSSLSAMTYIHALNPGSVVLNGPLFIGRSTRKDSYIKIQGLTFEGGGTLFNADYTTIKDCGFHGNFAVGTNSHDQYNDYNLIEDVWIWAAGGRVVAINYRSHYNVWRRVVVRGDGCGTADCTGGGNPNVGISVYDSNNVSLQNVIVVDRILASGDTPYADFATAQHTSNKPTYFLGNNEWLGTMSIKAPDQGYNFEADNAIDQTAKIQNAVAWDSAGSGINVGVIATNNLLENLTARATGLDGVRLAPGVTGTLRNVLVAGAGRYGINSSSAPSYTDVFGAATSAYNQTTCATVCNTTDPRADSPGPSLKYLTRIETGSLLKGAGLGGADIGANIVFRYGADGTRFGETNYNALTATPLWPWPNENRIKNEMCAGTTRGFCSSLAPLGSGGGIPSVTTLTTYIWEYLGNPIPAGIYP